MGLLSYLGRKLFRSDSGTSEQPGLWSSIFSTMLRKSKAGVTVSPEKALALPTYYACIQALSSDVAKLPFVVYRSDGEDGIPDAANPIYPLLKIQAGPGLSAFTFRETMTAWALGWGNAYAEIVRDLGGVVRELCLIHPSRVAMKRRDDGTLFYEIRTGQPGSMEALPYERAEIFHLHGLGDGALGWSVAQVGCESLGVALAQQEYAGEFFGNGTSIGGILSHPGALKPEARKNLRESWQEQHGSGKAHGTAVLEEGMTYTPTAVNPRDAQVIESRQFQVNEVCRWFRMPPHKIQDLTRATFSNIEQQEIGYVNDTLMPWLVRWEQETQIKLLGLDEKHYAKHRVQAQMRGDAAARGAFYSQLFNIGSISANEIRRLEDMPAMEGEGGDAYFVQGALVPIETQLKATAPGTAPAAKPADKPKPAGDKPEEPTDEPA